MAAMHEDHGPVAIVLPHLPDRAHSGIDLRHRALVRALGALGDVHVFGVCHRPAPTPPAWTGVRSWTCSSDPTVTPTRLTASGTGWMGQDDGHPSDSWFVPSVAEDLATFVRRTAPRLVVLGGLDLHRYRDAARSTGAPLVLDAANVETDVATAIAELAMDPREVLVRRLVAARTATLEAAVARDVDAVWVCSEHDRRRFAALHPSSAPITVIPNVVDADPDPDPDPTVGIDRDAAPPSPRAPLLLYPGSFAYPPNADAAVWLLDEVLPGVRRHLPTARLALVGADPPAHLLARAGAAPAGAVEVTGLVPDTAPWFVAATVVPVALRAGAGTRLKILEAFAHGVPVVSTPKGWEGLDVEPGVHLLSAATTEELVAAIVDVHRDPEQAARRAQHGREIVERRYKLAGLISALGPAVGR